MFSDKTNKILLGIGIGKSEIETLYRELSKDPDTGIHPEEWLLHVMDSLVSVHDGSLPGRYEVCMNDFTGPENIKHALVELFKGLSQETFDQVAETIQKAFASLFE